MHRVRIRLRGVGGDGMAEPRAGDGAEAGADGVGLGGCVAEDGRGEDDVLQRDAVRYRAGGAGGPEGESEGCGGGSGEQFAGGGGVGGGWNRVGYLILSLGKGGMM